MAAITLERVDKRYRGAAEKALDGLDLAIDDGEFMVLVGPSGCGKSTALRTLAGLEEVTAGVIRIGDRVVNDLGPKDRDVAMVFQNYALYPHMTVAQNLAFGLRLRKVDRAERDRRVAEVARLLGLDQLLHRRPRELSGGQRQRVAMGRAIVREPQAFLMDEPLSNLDAKLRVDMRAALKQLHDRLGVTTVYVTHDQVEAMTLGDRVTVLRNGRLQQVGPPQELYDRPANLFVAGFLGSPAMNVVRADVTRDGPPRLRFGPVALDLPADRLDAGLGRYVGGTVIAGIRPHDLRLVPAGAGPAAVEVTADVVEALGSSVNVLFRLPGCQGVDTGAYEAPEDELDAAVLVEEDAVVWSATLDPQAGIRTGHRLALAVDVAAMHFFDPATGLAVAERAVPAPV